MMKSRYLPLATTALIFVLAYAACALQFPNILSTRVVGNLLPAGFEWTTSHARTPDRSSGDTR